MHKTVIFGFHSSGCCQNDKNLKPCIFAYFVAANLNIKHLILIGIQNVHVIYFGIKGHYLYLVNSKRAFLHCPKNVHINEEFVLVKYSKIASRYLSYLINILFTQNK